MLSRGAMVVLKCGNDRAPSFGVPAPMTPRRRESLSSAPIDGPDGLAALAGRSLQLRLPPTSARGLPPRFSTVGTAGGRNAAERVTAPPSTPVSPESEAESSEASPTLSETLRACRRMAARARRDGSPNLLASDSSTSPVKRAARTPGGSTSSSPSQRVHLGLGSTLPASRFRSRGTPRGRVPLRSRFRAAAPPSSWMVARVQGAEKSQSP